MDKNVAYGFLVGLNLGRFSNFFSNLIISGVVTYFYTPEFYTYSTIEKLLNMTKTFIKG